MKALWFLPFTFACGAEGFALFAPYLIGLLCILHVARAFHHARRGMPVAEAIPGPDLADLGNAQPAM